MVSQKSTDGRISLIKKQVVDIEDNGKKEKGRP
jgi:hypothetical protein